MILAIALLLISQATLFAQTSPVPYAPQSDGPGPTFHSETRTDSLPGSYSSIRDVDFRNLKPLKGGRYQKDDPGVRYSETLDHVYYLGGSRSNAEAALVLASWFSVGGSSSQGGVAKVFRIIDGTLRLTQNVEWDTHFQTKERFVSFERRTGTLLIRSSHYIPGDAHCCVSAVDVVTYRWNGTAFVQLDIQTELSEYGRKHKHLPR